MKRARKKFRPLKIAPAEKDNGLTDVSEKHDYYLAFPDATGPAPTEFNEPARSR